MEEPKSEVIEEPIPVVTTEDMNNYYEQLTLILIHMVDKLGGLVELPTMTQLWSQCEGRSVMLTRNTDGTAQIFVRKEGANAC